MRLKQYKLLEKKAVDSRGYSSNEDFLKQSQIVVQIKRDCNQHFDRLLDLIARSNQLNYTKKRETADSLHLLLNNPQYDNGYVEVMDRYGEYGIVGFFSVKNGKADHFLFSCRTIGMGVEQYVYSILGCPIVDVVEPVRTELLKNGTIPDWINCDSNISIIDSTPQINERRKVLISGGCDLEQMAAYLHGTGMKITYKFNIGGFRHDHTSLIVGSKLYNNEIKEEIIKKVPFINKASLSPDCFESQYNIVVLKFLLSS